MAPRTLTRRTVKFTVDAALLRELGARLVGQPHIALAELIKNSYDADARNVRIEFNDDTIVLEDDGHGMSYDAFVRYWMRVGTTHKSTKRASPELQRTYTGSKGVGRLAAQLLATKLEVTSTALKDPATDGYSERHASESSQLEDRIVADVNWDQSVTAGELTSVEVPVRRDRTADTYANGAPMGTRLTMTGLTTDWDEASFRSLAQEIWALEPPFEIDEDAPEAFNIELVSPYGAVVEEFDEQMQAIFDNWRSVIVYELSDDDPDADVLFELDPYAEIDDIADDGGTVAPPPAKRRGDVAAKLLTVSIVSREKDTAARRMKIRVLNCTLDKVECEIRVFNLARRQGNNVRVEDARRYMARFGGVHIYDGGFRLPYYGPQDWLELERDHARRLSRSYLLPEQLRDAKQLHDLPSARRVFGSARISTAHEATTVADRNVDPGDVLTIQVTRDRLADNAAFRTLQRIIRVGLDLYADGVHRTPKDPPSNGSTPSTRPSTRLQEVRAAVVAARDALDEQTYQTITDTIDEAASAAGDLEQRSDQLAGLLGALATVGMTTLAWDHEASKQRHIVMDTSVRLRSLEELTTQERATELDRIADELESSARSLNDVASLFKPVLDRTSRETVTRLRARPFVRSTVKKLHVLGRGAEVTVEIPETFLLPAASVAAWSAVLQNLVVNAFNAVLDTDERRVDIDAGSDGSTRWLRIQDTGIGIDLKEAPTYFAPFARGMGDDPRRAELGLGGSGLGLTIVRMITDPIGVSVAFVEPDDEHATSVVLEWESAT